MDISNHINYEMKSAIEKCIECNRVAGNLGKIDHVWIRAFSRLNFSVDDYGQFALKHFFDIVIKNPEQNFGKAACGFVSANTFIPIDLFANNTFRHINQALISDNFINGTHKINPEKISGEKFHIWLHPIVSFIVEGYRNGGIANIVKQFISDGHVVIPQVSFLINHTFKIVVSDESPEGIAADEPARFATVDKDGWVVG